MLNFLKGQSKWCCAIGFDMVKVIRTKPFAAGYSCRAIAFSKVMPLSKITDKLSDNNFKKNK